MTPCSLHRQREIIISPGHGSRLGQPNHGPQWPSLEVPGQPAGMLMGWEPHPALALLLGALQLVTSLTLH